MRAKYFRPYVPLDLDVGANSFIGNLHAIAFKRKVQCGFCLHAVALGHKLGGIK